MEDVAVEDLVARFGSPLFLISETTLRRRARRIRAAFQRAWPVGDVLVMPSIKANPVIALQRILAQERFGSDLVHAGELEVAVRAGIDPSLVSLNGSGKDLATVERAVALGARVTIDDIREIELARRAAQATGKRAQIRMRLRPHVDTDATMQATGIPIVDVYGTYKSGIPHDDLAEAGKALSTPELDVSGVMMHMGRYTTDLDVIGRFSRSFGELTAEVSDLWGGWTPTSIDIGGGFAPPVDGFGRARPDYTDPPPAPEIEEYADVICGNLSQGLAAGGIDTDGRTLEIEPGRSLFAPCGIHVTTALNVKRQTAPSPFTWVDTDTSVTFLSDIGVSSARVARRLGERAATDARDRGSTDRRSLLPVRRAGSQLCPCRTGGVAGALLHRRLPRSGFKQLQRDAPPRHRPGARDRRRHRAPRRDR